MLQPRGDLDLAQEALGAEGRSELGVEHLDGDGPVVFEVLGEKHGRRETVAQLPLQGVASG